MVRKLIVDDHYIPTPAEIAEHRAAAIQVRQEWLSGKAQPEEMSDRRHEFGGAVPRKCPDCGRAWVGCRCPELA